ncbi:UvrD-helicase domain-containing protein [Cryobacterium sp. TMT2-4]|uniref:UvrD-helicase domain-containing protein n=1 Tax=Cryobacterium sp. TMT2-4 TaxID=1259254 RepID=UPI00106A1248|nr:UvrD-helicase domain-containing protein [Cryobacterium sp. TMT2-4]TFC69338.1 DNA helicase UvrD [Cryobacterium sp. TMT2-4]
MTIPNRAQTWHPSALGKRVTKSRDWRLTLTGPELTITLDGEPVARDIGSFGGLTVTPGRLWSHLELEHPDRRFRFRGIPNRRAASFATAFTAAQAEAVRVLRLLQLVDEFDQAAKQVRLFTEALGTAVAVQLKTKGWLTTEFSAYWAARKAAVGFGQLLDDPDLRPHITELSAVSRETVNIWRDDLPEFVAAQNERHLAAELDDCQDFFDTVEKSPLTPEQARAVVCFDNRMLVVAAAGSGKTSTMVAKAGYALHRNLIPADKILMLAFNNAAAKELGARTQERLAPLGLDAGKVVAKTFHAFGLEIIGKATGRKPSLAPWLEGGGDIKQLGRIVDVLRATNPPFRLHWDFFRAVLARDYPDPDAELGETDKPPAFRTAQGEQVRSTGERMIADWLYFNSVEYVYERSYEVDTADSEHRQYHPDFYYPQIDAYHEHWAVDENGQAPEEFVGYLDGMQWKRETHRRHGTTLLETTRAQLWSGEGLSHLEKELTERGIRLQANPERLLAGQTPTDYGRLLQTFRSFLTHAKSNRLSDDQLRQRLEEQSHGEVRFRDAAFLRLFAPIRREWDKKLAAEGCIDFEDMLNLSADHLEAGDWESPYELVMVDEFQDASHARARLTRGLVAQPGCHLFAVGDDWQSINRFAGADLSVMTDFEHLFGPSEVLRLERTFRFPQSIADVSSRFVLQNPTQLIKRVVSSTPEFPPTIGAVSVDTDKAVKAAIHHRLKALHTQIARGRIPQPVGVKVTVFVLGRYRHQSDCLPDCRDLADLLDVEFMTIHASKGAEADYIVIPGMVSGKWGFPSTIPNDPVLRMAMPAAEDFKRAEERRLFYVAMTRARRGVLLVTVKNRESPFLMELIRDHGIVRTNAIGEALDSTVCPRCGRAFMVERPGKRGPFLGCRRYPRCKSTLALT